MALWFRFNKEHNVYLFHSDNHGTGNQSRNMFRQTCSISLCPSSIYAEGNTMTNVHNNTINGHKM